MPVADIIRRELNLHSSFAYSPENFVEALKQIGAGMLRLDPWVIESPLENGSDWFERQISASGDVAKVLLVPNANA